ncbi:hypothetical protein QFZ96_001802 [Paraburkholderia youngii]
MTDIFSLVRGGAPLIISIPHLGTTIPEDLRDDFSDVALTLADTDWHLDQLYDFGHNLGATIVTAKVSRYVIDLNRPPSDESLYPGQETTGLYPVHTFRGESVYRDGRAPDTHEKARRLRTYWRPYHECLVEEIRRLGDRGTNRCCYGRRTPSQVVCLDCSMERFTNSIWAIKTAEPATVQYSERLSTRRVKADTPGSPTVGSRGGTSRVTMERRAMASTQSNLK